MMTTTGQCPSNTGKLLTAAEVAERLAISTRQLKQLSDAGEIAFVNVGLGPRRPARRYRPEDVDEFISRRTVVSSGYRPARAITSIPPGWRMPTIAEVVEQRAEKKRQEKAERERKSAAQRARFAASKKLST
jgi:excisionase family DNA binding protein